jgi:hypothetical protein
MTNEEMVVGALFDFGGFLTGQDGEIVAGAAHDAIPMVDMLKKFMALRGIEAMPEDAAVTKWQDEIVRDKDFRNKVEEAINWCSMENGSDTPDFILADFLTDCLRVFGTATTRRERWYGREIGEWQKTTDLTLTEKETMTE